jgi:pimeloyl-ACP methyl ester carboxylesterase
MLRRVTAPDGVELAFDDLGPADGPPVVLMHGGGQTRHSWAGTALALARAGHRVLNMDLRGHGASGWSADGAYGLDDRVADLRALLHGVAGTPALVGASLGGYTALHAVAGGLAVRALVLVDIVPHPEPAGIARILTFMRAHPSGFASLEEAADAVAAYNPDRPRPRDAGGLKRNLRQRADGRWHWHWDPRILSDTGGPSLGEVVQRSAGALARHPELPVLLVRGLASDVVSDAGIARFRALVPQLELADVAGAGHMVAGDRNDAFAAAAIGFLERVGVPA